MCIICETKNIGDIVYIEKLDCSHCPFIQRIPDELVNLTQFFCIDCPLLQSIPKELVNLTGLFCFDCPLLQSIPNECVNITSLWCNDCPLLQSIPKELVNISHLSCINCPWLENDNRDYNNNIYKLLLLQKWFRGCLMSRKLKKLYKPILEIYFHPEYKGGYLHKRNMMSFVSLV